MRDDAHGEHEQPDEAEPASEPELPAEVPPELQAVPEKEMNAVLEQAMVYALRKTKNKSRADALVSEAYVRLTTTRRWVPSKGPLAPHVLRIVKSLFLHEITSKAPEREALVHAGYHREMRPVQTVSAEEMMLERAEELADEERRAGVAAEEIAQLRVRIAKHPTVPEVLRLKEEGIEEPREIARILGLEPKQVYRAIEMLKYHLDKIREAAAASGSKKK